MKFDWRTATVLGLAVMLGVGCGSGGSGGEGLGSSDPVATPALPPQTSTQSPSSSPTPPSNPRVVRLELSTSRLAVRPGVVSSVLVMARFENGTQRDVTIETSWATRDDNLARVMVSGGQVIAGRLGTSLVVASFDDATAVLEVVCSASCFGWGSNSNGILGIGSNSERDQLPSSVPLPAGVRATKLFSGFQQSFVTTDDRRLFGWGHNSWGQLGSASPGLARSPIEVALPTGEMAVQAAPGVGHSLIRAASGNLYSCGENAAGQLGDGTWAARNSPVLISLDGSVLCRDISTKYATSMAVGDNGVVYAWGENLYGQLGDGTRAPRNSPSPVEIPSNSRVKKVCVGSQYALALSETGRVFAWGNNTQGELGMGDRVARLTPVEIPFGPEVRIIQLDAGARHNLAVSDNGKLYAWGENAWGALGDGTKDDRLSPIEIQLPTNSRALQISAGAHHSMALTEDNQLYGWGGDQAGMLGGVRDKLTPFLLPIPSGKAVYSVSAGAFTSHVLAE